MPVSLAIIHVIIYVLKHIPTNLKVNKVSMSAKCFKSTAISTEGSNSTDRHHWKNHTGCSESYNCDSYDYLKKVNSPICEQKNRSLRILSSALAYCGVENYMTNVKLFFMMSNYEEKGLFN